MARIAGYRAVVSTNGGTVSRLSNDFCNAQINDRDVCMVMHAAKGGLAAWTISMHDVVSISSHGANIGSPFARVALSPEDVDALRSGAKKLALVDA